ncbi:hypothetical protein [Polaromonas sp.]|uniref:hypothetical protein n=1 Tax=Polaromonas sp. TaxID=1869339 RepID=UPI00326373BE
MIPYVLTPLRASNHSKVFQNLEEYVRSAKKDLTVLGISLDWDAWKWPGVGSFIKQGPVEAGHSRRKNVPFTYWLDPAFIDFAKAFIRERCAQNPRASVTASQTRLAALRMLELALLEFHPSAAPANIDLIVLDRTAALASEHFSYHQAYLIGKTLESIAKVLTKQQLVCVAVGNWTSPTRHERPLGGAVGSSGEAYRSARLPDVNSLQAMAEIFNHTLNPLDPTHQRDIYTTSITALLLGGPSRGGEEVHHLPVDLVIRATDRFGKEQLGLRWEAGKGFGHYVKWIWDGMVPTVEIALDRLRRMTEGAREFARWMENPKTACQFYRHEGCPDVDGAELLTVTQVCMALGMSTINPPTSLRQVGLVQQNYTYSLNDLWKLYVLPLHKKNHPDFPYIDAKQAAKGKKGGLKFSEALFCMRAHQLHGLRGTSPFNLWMPSLMVYGADTRCSTDTRANIFDRHGYRGSDGGSLTLKSHSLRHLLNTEAQRGGMTNEDIAWWSGRVHQAQNQVYNHMTEQERVDRAKERLGDKSGRMSIVPFHANDPNASVGEPASHQDSHAITKCGYWNIDSLRKPVSCNDLDLQPQLAGINTLYGRCEHDYVLSPCEGLGHCLDCNEHSCIKGSGTDEREKLMRINELMDRVAREVDRAKAKLDQGDWGAQDWYTAQCKWYDKLKQLVEILHSNRVPDGAVIKLAGANSQTHLHRVLRSVAMRGLENETLPDCVVQEMLNAIKQHDEGSHPIIVYRPPLLPPNSGLKQVE